MNEKEYKFSDIDRDTAPASRKDTTHFDVINMETYLTKRGMSLKKSRGPGKYEKQSATDTYTAEMNLPSDTSERFIVGEAKFGNRIFILTTTTTPNFQGTDLVYEVTQYGVIPPGAVRGRKVIGGGTGWIDLGLRKLFEVGDLNTASIKYKVMRVLDGQSSPTGGIFGYDTAIAGKNFLHEAVPNTGSLDTKLDHSIKTQYGTTFTAEENELGVFRMSEYEYSYRTLFSGSPSGIMTFSVDDEILINESFLAGIADSDPWTSTIPLYMGAVNTSRGISVSESIIIEYWSFFGVKDHHDNNWGGIDVSMTQDVYTVDDWNTWEYTPPLRTPGSLDSDVVLRLIDVGDLGLSTLHPVDTAADETNGILKIYMVDGNIQPRYIDVTNGMVYQDTPKVYKNSLFAPAMTVPHRVKAKEHPGIGLVEAKVRYAAYTYETNGSSTKMSALSAPINIGKDVGIAKVTVSVGIGDGELFQGNNARVYRITYLDYGSPPLVNLVLEASVPYDGTTIEFVDDGGLYISDVAFDDFVLIGSQLFIADSVSSNKGHLFFGGISGRDFSIGGYDARAYGFTDNNTNIKLESGSYAKFIDVPLEDDVITLDPDLYNKIKGDSTVYGVTGENLEIRCVSITYDNLQSHTDAHNRLFFKINETYRIGAVFVDEYGRWSAPEYVCDYKIPYYEVDKNPGGTQFSAYKERSSAIALSGKVHNLPVGAIGYKFVIAERTPQDKTILAQGIGNPMMRYEFGSTNSLIGSSPFPVIRHQISFAQTGFGQAMDINRAETNGWDYTTDNNKKALELSSPEFLSVLSPETFMSPSAIPGSKLISLGTVFNSELYTLQNFRGINSSQYYNFTSDDFITKLDGMPGYTAGITNIPYCIYAHYGAAPAEGETVVNRYIFQRGFDGPFGSLELPVNLNKVNDIKTLKFGDFEGFVSFNSDAFDMSPDYINFNMGAAYYSDMQSEIMQRYIIEMDTPGWGGTTGFEHAHVDNVYKYGLPIVDIYNPISTQYGGNTYGTKARTVYIDASEVETDDWVVMFGDTYMGVYKMVSSTGSRNFDSSGATPVYDFLYVRMEGSVDWKSFCPKIPDLGAIYGGTTGESILPIEAKQYLTYDTVFSQITNEIFHVGLPRDNVSVESLPQRVQPSYSKNAASSIDQLTLLDTRFGINLESKYGPLIALIEQGDSLVAFQNTGISVIQVLPVSQTTGTSGVVTLGKGSLLDSYKYVKVDTGIGRLEAVCHIEDKIFFIDEFNRTLNSLEDGVVSKLLGFSQITDESIDYSAGFVNNDPNGFSVSTDTRNTLVMFRVPGYGMLCFDYVRKIFTHRRSYLESNRIIDSTSFTIACYNSSIYRLDVGEYDHYFRDDSPYNLSGFTLWVDPDNSQDKVFDAIGITGAGTNPDTIFASDDFHESDTVPAKFRGSFDRYTVHMPRIFGTRSRFRSSNVKVTLSSSSAEDLIIDSIFVMYTIKK